MADDSNRIKKPHTLLLDNRKSVSVSGVSDVDSFDDREVVAYTDIGELTVHGENLHINKLSVDTGDLQIEGKIDSLSYSDSKPISGGGIFSRLFK